MRGFKVMKNLISIFMLILSLTLLVTCSKKVEVTNEKVLNIAIPAKVKGMDPIYSNDRYSSNEIARVYEGLLEYHYLTRPYTLVPNLASEMPTISADGLTYTFKIKKGVYFHDDKSFPNGKGRELDAEDFVYSIKRLADPKLQALGWWILDGKIAGLNEWRKKYTDKDKVNYKDVVSGLKSLDKYTIQFKLVKPFPQFLYSLAMTFTFAVPKEVVGFYGKEFLNHPVGTGAFTLKEFKQNNKMIYLKNPSFRKKYYPTTASDEFKSKGFLKDAGKRLPLLDKIIVQTMIESQPRWLSFQKGKLDYMSIPKDNYSSAITPDKKLTPSQIKKKINLMITPSLDVTYMAFNHDNKLFSNKKLRQAIMAAYDIDRANELLSNGRGLPAQSIVPPGISGYIDGYKNPFRGPNLELAAKLLEEAGYPKGKGLPEINFDVSSGTDARQGGELFKNELKKIGVEIKVISNPWTELQNKITKRTVMMYGIAWGADYPDAENFLQLLYGPNRAPGANGSGYDNPIFNSLYEKASVMQDSPERTAFYEKMYKMAAEEVPIVYGLHRQSYDLYHSWLGNYIRADFDSGQAQYLNIDLAMKKKLIESAF